MILLCIFPLLAIPLVILSCYGKRLLEKGDIPGMMKIKKYNNVLRIILLCLACLALVILVGFIVIYGLLHDFNRFGWIIKELHKYENITSFLITISQIILKMVWNFYHLNIGVSTFMFTMAWNFVRSGHGWWDLVETSAKASQWNILILGKIFKIIKVSCFYCYQL